jgi:hypothetical protein
MCFTYSTADETSSLDASQLPQAFDVSLNDLARAPERNQPSFDCLDWLSRFHSARRSVIIKDCLNSSSVNPSCSAASSTDPNPRSETKRRIASSRSATSSNVSVITVGIAT